MDVVVAAAEYVTVPLPVPVFADVIVTHGRLFATVQEQLVGAATTMLPVAPA